ncbi:MAG: 30S ribosomal protein S2 [DPANN group archaeon]|nr:30S ribosomal protein S2 [DPANN group archaeon]
MKLGIPIIGLCDSNNTTENLNIIVPCNNKGAKSLGLIFWILANEYLKARGELKEGEQLQLTADDFTSD